MTEGRFDRLLAACLHQGILELLPQRLDFYEHWLGSSGLRGGNIGPAPMLAVLGFLRTEGEAYERVVTRAGQLAAGWTVASMPGLRRRAIAVLPRPLRVRAAMRVTARIARIISGGGRVSAQVRRGGARLDVKTSPFCAVRERHATPLCGFYAAVATETLGAFGLSVTSRLERCRAVDGSSCVVTIETAGAGAAPDPAIAA